MSEQGRILIISDTKSDADEFERVLRSEGCEVETATTAEAGLARAKKGDFDVVLTDLHLSVWEELRQLTLEGARGFAEWYACKRRMRRAPARTSAVQRCMRGLMHWQR
jgi:CheY-like chemotaxis protein